MAGSEKRIKELKVAFDSPDRYGKGLDWTGYTVHDAANILRRYFNQLPEPIIPLEFYDRFRGPLRNHQAQAVGTQEAQNPSVGDFDPEAAIKAYKGLITELPPLNRQLLLYILDLLAVFASKSDLNKMTTGNLAAIFQPGILSHPQHDMAPQEYRLSQDVLIFLIENQDSFLIGMQGTAADPETVREVQSGTPVKQSGSPSTSRSKTIGRSSSNASAGAESVRKFGSIRRNVSVASKHSKKSEALATPNTPTSGGVHRSNTVPSRRAGSTNHSPRFSREKHSDPSTPSPITTSADATVARQESMQNTPVASTAPAFPPMAAPEVISASSSEVTTPMAVTVGSDTSSAIRSDYTTPKKDTTPLLAPPGGSGERHPERTPSNTPSATGSRGFLDIFKTSPTSEGERKPNKLQKKRLPGSSLSSAHSSSHSLQGEGPHDTAPKSPVTPSFPSGSKGASTGTEGTPSAYNTAQTTPVHATPQRNPTDATLRPTSSPTHSYQSTDLSDADLVGDDQPASTENAPDKEKKKHRWRFSKSQNKLDQGQPQPPGSSNPLGTMSPREVATSKSTISSFAGGQPRKSFQEPMPLAASVSDSAAGTPAPSQQTPSGSTDPVFSDSERERRGPMSWIRGKIQERKDKEAEKRAQTPDRGRDRSESKQDLQIRGETMPVRGKSFEQQRSNVVIVAPGKSFEQQRVDPTNSEGPKAAAATDAEQPVSPMPTVPAIPSGDGSQSTAVPENGAQNGDIS